MRFPPLLLAGLLIGGVAASGQNPSTASIPLRAQVQVLGTGSAIVLLGGGLLGADGWGGIPAALAKTHRVINVQSLAVQYGLENQPLPDGYSLRTEVAALRETLDSLGTERVHLIGMSHGGVIALLFALDNPPRVHTLTLVEPPAFWVLRNHGYDDPGARAMQQFVSSLRGAAISEEHVEQFRCLLGDCAGGRSPRQSPQWNQWVKYRNSLRALHTIGDYSDDPGRLRNLAVPALVVEGSATVPFHRAINAALVKSLPMAERLELGGGHNSPAASPDHFIAEWQRFQQRVASRAAGPASFTSQEALNRSFDAMLEQVEAAQVRLVNGQPDAFKALWSHDDEITLSGGLGGAIAKGWTQVSERLDWVATQYLDGARTHQQVARHVGQDLAYVVLRETIRFKSRADGRPMIQELRVTQVFRLEAGRWRIVHRHADSQVTQATPG